MDRQLNMFTKPHKSCMKALFFFYHDTVLEDYTMLKNAAFHCKQHIEMVERLEGKSDVACEGKECTRQMGRGETDQYMSGNKGKKRLFT